MDGHNGERLTALEIAHQMCRDEMAKDVKEIKEGIKELKGNGKLGIFANVRLAQAIALAAMFIALTAFNHNGGKLDDETIKTLTPLIKQAVTAAATGAL